ncbi:FkbM family methyltransferase [Skermanella rosea]|uniref:FkbM family methyltransferase n=1 Tax=Skermanella rosea TaxID=1817965 RepID=UPI001933FEA9|nr:FkbM family methyltransferase [Skermanella rosea]UEM04417.1 FkbM family methyltransferase [Skermanella rosea]
MTFISYAQNYEDIMLFRALRGVEQGFYVDVGANSPDEHSVTRAFYERGWRGINIEPVLEFHRQLLEARPRDVNLPIAIADRTGFIEFHDVAGTGLSTINPKIAENHRAAGYQVTRRSVVVETLDEVFRKYVSGEVHFLKIDVEGLEGSVLRGLSLEEIRPWIIVVEATEVLSQVQSHASWEPRLKERGYSFVYFDGLNRFYVADEHADLAGSFESPPNVFDDWMRITDRQAHDRANVLSAKLEEERESYRSELEILKAQVEEWKTRAEAAQAAEAARRAEEAARRAEDESRRLELEARLGELMRALDEAAAAGARASEREARLLDQMADLSVQAAGLRTGIVALREGMENSVQAETAALRHRLAELEHASFLAKLELDSVLASSSWRITAPMRGVKMAAAALARSMGDAGGSRPGPSLVSRAAHWSARQPVLKRAAVAVLARSPALERKVRSLVAPPPGVPATAVADIPPPRRPDRSGPAIVSRSPSPAEAIVETAFRRALARAR